MFKYKQKMLLRSVIGVALVFLSCAAFSGVSDEPYAQVDLGQFIKENRPHKKNGKSIVPPKNISFYGKIMQLPREGKFEYVYLALDVMHVSPVPEITHQMFIADDQGKVVSMYVEKRAAQIFNKYLKVGQRLNFNGYHVYNYKRGPAIVLEGVLEVNAPEKAASQSTHDATKVDKGDEVSAHRRETD